MALLVIRSAFSGEVLAEFDGDEFTQMVEARGNTVKALKLELKDKGHGSRFRLRLLKDATEMQDDEILVPPLDLKLVKIDFCRCEEAEIQMFIDACKEGRLEEVERRLKKPQDPDATVGRLMERGWTSLYITALNGQSEVVRLLLEGDASCTRPLLIAVDKGNLEMVHLLLFARAPCDGARDDGTTPLHLATDKGRPEMVRLLLEARASCDGAREDGATALHLAAE